MAENTEDVIIEQLVYHEYHDVERIDASNLEENICEATRKECERIRDIKRDIKAPIVSKYLRMLNNAYLTERIAEMLSRGDYSVTLMWDKVKDDDRFVDRERIFTKPLREVAESVNVADYPHIVDWDRSIRETLLALLPQDYRLYYHYDYRCDTSTIIGYEVTIYRGNPVWYDPWCQFFCCWDCLERNADYCRFPEGRL